MLCGFLTDDAYGATTGRDAFACALRPAGARCKRASECQSWLCTDADAQGSFSWDYKANGGAGDGAYTVGKHTGKSRFTPGGDDNPKSDEGRCDLESGAPGCGNIANGVCAEPHRHV